MNADELPETISDRDRSPTLQTTAFTVGQLFVFSMSSHFAEIPRGWDWRTAPTARTLLKQIWPLAHEILEWPPDSMTDADAHSFATSVIRYFDDLAKRKGYR